MSLAACTYADVSQFTTFFPGTLVTNNFAAIANMQNAFGVTPPRHEPPRRLLVSGKNIRFGAVLEVAINGDCNDDHDIRLPLYATEFLEDGYPVWTTAVEADALVYYDWLTSANNRHGIRLVNTDGTSTCVDDIPMHLNDWP